MKVRLTQIGESPTGEIIPAGTVLGSPMWGRRPLPFQAEQDARSRERLDLLRMMQMGRGEPADAEARQAIAESNAARAAAQEKRDKIAAARQAEQDAQDQAIAEAAAKARTEEFAKQLMVGTLPPAGETIDNQPSIDDGVDLEKALGEPDDDEDE